VPGVPVGYVDAYYLFEDHPRVTAACDVVMTNCYPFWEGCPREHALAYMQTMVARTRAAAPGKRVLISETGWPDQGSAFKGSVPSREGAMQYFVDCCTLGCRRRHRTVLLCRLRRSLEGGRRR
jgi:glucan 1,3-beta-glucosidase